MCSYKEKKSDPTEMSTLDGYTVDYTEPVTGQYAFSSALNKGTLIDCVLSNMVLTVSYSNDGWLGIDRL